MQTKNTADKAVPMDAETAAKYPKTITYYAAALNPQGKIGQLLVTRVLSAPGVKVSGGQEWTGVTYRTQREAMADLSRLNSNR